MFVKKSLFFPRKTSTKLHLKGFEVQHCVIFVRDFCLLAGRRIKDYVLWTLYGKGRYCYLGAKGFEMWQVADASVVIVSFVPLSSLAVFLRMVLKEPVASPKRFRTLLPLLWLQSPLITIKDYSIFSCNFTPWIMFFFLIVPKKTKKT